ncbi:acetate--CoA ligase family protein [bacterium]|nr:acetate--CoA ligase family protein [candidate division CSSED10-310 bacterium]
MQRLFYPSSLAVVGLSPSPGNIARVIVENCRRYGFQGRIYGVNPRGGEVHGVTIHSRIEDLPAPVDVAVLLMPARHIPPVIDACGRAGVPYAALPASGFNEVGEGGRAILEEVLERAAAYGMRILGPNGLMVLNADNGLALPFFPLPRYRTGGVSLLVQSGGVGLSLLTMLSNHGLGIQKFVSMGNKADLDEVDLLEFLAGDAHTEVICVYLESIRRGRLFMSAVGACRKPVILCKSNRREEAGRTAFSHTAAEMNDDVVVDDAARQCGAIRVERIEDLVLVAKRFQLPVPDGDRVIVMSPSGGHAVIAADEGSRLGLKFPPISHELQARITSAANAGVVKTGNPIDLGDVYNPVAVHDIVIGAAMEPSADSLVLAMIRQQEVDGPGARDNPLSRLNGHDYITAVNEAVEKSGKPVAVVFYSETEKLAEMRRHCRAPIFDDIPEALSAVHFRLTYRKAAYAFEEPSPPENLDSVRALFRSRSRLDLQHCLRAVELMEIPVPSWRVITGEDDLAAAAGVGFPLVLKPDSALVTHKSDLGLVLRRIHDPEELVRAYRNLRGRLAELPDVAAAEIVPLVIAQHQVPSGVEVIAGCKRDAAFGPVLMVGLGGILVHILGDLARHVGSLSIDQAHELLRRLRGYPILAGARGAAPVDLGSLAGMLHRLGTYACHCPELEEMDINPYIMTAGGDGGMAVDARIRVTWPEIGQERRPALPVIS